MRGELTKVDSLSRLEVCAFLLEWKVEAAVDSSSLHGRVGCKWDQEN